MGENTLLYRPAAIRTFVALLFALTILAVPLNTETAAASAVKEYVALGNSLAAGLGADFLYGYVERFYSRLRETNPEMELINLGHTGDTSTDLIRHGHLAHAIALQPDVITLDIGANDIIGVIMEGRPLEPAMDKVAVNLNHVFHELTTKTDALILILDYYNPYPRSHPLHARAERGVVALNNLIHATARKFSLPVVSVYRQFRQDPLLLTWAERGDIHPSNRGHQAIANALWQAYRRISKNPDLANRHSVFVAEEAASRPVGLITVSADLATNLNELQPGLMAELILSSRTLLRLQVRDVGGTNKLTGELGLVNDKYTVRIGISDAGPLIGLDYTPYYFLTGQIDLVGLKHPSLQATAQLQASERISTWFTAGFSPERENPDLEAGVRYQISFSLND